MQLRVAQKQKRRKEATPPRALHRCEATVDRAMDLFFWIYDIAAVSWDKNKVQRMAAADDFTMKAAYVKKQYDIMGKVTAVIVVMQAGELSEYAAYLSSPGLTVGKVCAERKDKHGNGCAFMIIKSEGHKKVLSELNIKNVNLYALSVLAPKLLLKMMNPELMS
uniref:Uncharacterized protein n=1 Tax=Chromera velia CCMP2878 TaxID=1169474 RepID=A0A0G4FWH2_9ALVE|eukprot:Cvel_19126.t1-p1 / transcript=Cvel_19126.t1 / gene=Cvel_19126 / organism=Chromera_velia_CCMP2878 / gene_product=hypothetical protein / transcript_product=hypothetical protein / location=Cvel_scaffold1625:22736-23670(+) / protein_length=163 / sequence_SO=supercontig / SO=protein_coding / is_pseudo=false